MREWSVRQYPTRPEEARETCRAIRSLIDGGVDPRRIGIVARMLEPELLAALHCAASDFELTLSRPAGRPLASHPFGRTLRMLLQVRELRFPRALVIELASAPLRRDFWGFSFHPERLDSATRRAEIAGGPSTWVKTSLRRVETDHRYELEQVTAYIRVLEHLERLTEPLATRRRGARWAETVEALCDAFVLETEQDLLALDALREIAAVCRRADATDISFDAEIVVQLLDSADELSERSSAGLAVWLGDVMKARGRAFDYLFVVDLRDGAFPQARTEDPLVPNADRRVAGVRQISDGRDEERLLFQLLLDSARNAIHFSWPASDGVRRVFYGSQLLKDFAQRHEPVPALRQLAFRNFSEYVKEKSKAAAQPTAQTRAEKKIAALAAGEPVLSSSLARRLDLLRLSGTRSRFDSYLFLTEIFQRELEEKLALLPPTRLEYYGQCPQRFLFTTVLGIGEIEDPEYELQISIRKKGGLDHQILENFYRGLEEEHYRSFDPSAGALSDGLQARLDEAITEEFRRHEADYPAPNQMIRAIEQKLTRKFLSEFVLEDLRDLLTRGFRPRYYEFEFGSEHGEKKPDHGPVTLQLGPRGVTLRGKIDRIDRNERSGEYRVVDYKSGKGIRFKEVAKLIADGTALQLGFYALAACAIFGVGPEKMHAAIKPLRLGEPEDKLSFRLSDIHEDLQATLAALGEAMIAGHFPAFPGRHCEYCAVGQWCRARHDPQQKHALDHYANVLELLQLSAEPLSPFPSPRRGEGSGVRGSLTADEEELS